MEHDFTLTKLQDKFPEAINSIQTFRKEITVYLKKEYLISVCRYLHDDPQLAYKYLSDLSGVDYLTAANDKNRQEPRFAIVYHLYSHLLKDRIRLKVLVN